MKGGEMKEFFKPSSIAVIGASRDERKLGFGILKNIIDGGFGGKIYPVNPKADSILNLKCFKSVSSIPDSVDLAVIVIPSQFVCDVAEECGKKGVKGVIVISAGFKEVGEEGRKREERLVEIVKKYGMRLVGPNCLGIIDPVNNLNASFAFDMPPKGKIAFITQSGALGTAVLDWACKEKVGLSKFVSFGNKADVSEIDLIRYLSEDEDTNVILLYIEGIKDGRKFIEVAKEVSMKKPVIALKSGTTSQGVKAVSSHTGSLAGSDKAYDAAFLQSGVIRVYSVEELFDTALAFSYQPLIKGEKIGIITNAGGPSIMAVDATEKSGLEVAQLSDETKEYLKSFLPPAANTNNPVDVLGDALADTYGKALRKLISDNSVDGVIAILTPQVVTQIKETAEEVVKVSKEFKKTIVSCFMGGKRMEEGIRILLGNSVPNYPYPERAVSSLKNMVKYRRWVEKEKGKVIKFEVEREKAKEFVEKLKNEKKNIIGDIEGREFISYYGINTINSYLARDIEECKKYAKQIGYPVVMKLVSPDIIHKTDAGGVKVGIKNEEEAEVAFNEIIDSAKRYKSDARIEGVQIQKYIENGIEVIIGVSKDPQFGHLIMFGLGGIYVEVLKDVAFRVVPLTEKDAEEMIEEVKTSKILSGFRNIPPADKEGIKQTILRVSQLCCDFPEIKEMDINPLMVMEKGAIAVDVRISFDF